MSYTHKILYYCKPKKKKQINYKQNCKPDHVQVNNIKVVTKTKLLLIMWQSCCLLKSILSIWPAFLSCIQFNSSATLTYKVAIHRKQHILILNFYIIIEMKTHRKSFHSEVSYPREFTYGFHTETFCNQWMDLPICPDGDCLYSGSLSKQEAAG